MEVSPLDETKAEMKARARTLFFLDGAILALLVMHVLLILLGTPFFIGVLRNFIRSSIYG